MLVNKRKYRSVIKGCLKGNESSLRQLYDLLFDNVVRSIKAFNLTLEETEDLVQESFIKIFRRLEKFDDSKSSIYTWSALIARGLAINYVKKKTLKTETIDLTKIRMYAQNEYSDHLEHDLILKEINRLPDNYKQVFMLSVIEDLDHNSIGQRLGITASSSRVYLARAKETLQSQLHSLYPKNTNSYDKIK